MRSQVGIGEEVLERTIRMNWKEEKEYEKKEKKFRKKVKRKENGKGGKSTETSWKGLRGEE